MIQRSFLKHIWNCGEPRILDYHFCQKCSFSYFASQWCCCCVCVFFFKQSSFWILKKGERRSWQFKCTFERALTGLLFKNNHPGWWICNGNCPFQSWVEGNSQKPRDWKRRVLATSVRAVCPWGDHSKNVRTKWISQIDLPQDPSLEQTLGNQLTSHLLQTCPFLPTPPPRFYLLLLFILSFLCRLLFFLFLICLLLSFYFSFLFVLFISPLFCAPVILYFFMVKSWHSRTRVLQFMIWKRAFCHKFLSDVVRRRFRETSLVGDAVGGMNATGSRWNSMEGKERFGRRRIRKSDWVSA